MNEELLKQIRETGDKDKILELFQEGRNILIEEYDTAINKMKRLNKDFAIDVLEEEILFYNSVIAIMADNFLKKYKIPDMNDEQKEMFTKMIDSIKIND
jgi:hypothetical protein